MLELVQKEDVTDTKELPFWSPRSTGFPCIVSDPDSLLDLLLGDVPIVQNFKCFFPAVTMNLASDEKLTDVTVEQEELALSFVISVPFLQSQR